MSTAGTTLDREPMYERHPSRLTAALVASVAVHVVLLLFLFLHHPEVVEPEVQPVILLPLSIEGSGGGGGGPIPGPPEPPAGPPEPEPAPAAAPAVAPAIVPKLTVPKKVVKPKKPVPPKAEEKPAEVAATGPATTSPDAGTATGTGTAATGTGTGSGGGGGGAGTGDGTGGDGSGGARPAHGSNPKPPYPLAARRMGQQGVVLLEVVVKPDGRAGDVRVRKSSGSEMLDQSALETVRDRWKFIPAKRDGMPIEATVTFPIRFQLDHG